MEKINAVNRVPVEILQNGALKYGIYNANGELQEYRYIKKEDEPSVAGTKVDKTLFDLIDNNTEETDGKTSQIGKYTIADGTSQTISGTDDIIPKSNWIEVEANTRYVNGDVEVYCGYTQGGSRPNITYYACDGDTTTSCTFFREDYRAFYIDFGRKYKLLKLNTYINNGPFYIYGSNDNENWQQVGSGSNQIALTEITMSSPDYYRYYRIDTSNNYVRYLYEIGTTSYEATTYTLSLPLKLSAYENNMRVLIKTPSDMETSATYYYININNLGNKEVKGIAPDTYYELVYNGTGFDIVRSFTL